jgi:hypothetical protein
VTSMWGSPPSDWSRFEHELWERTAGGLGIEQDRYAQALYAEGWFNWDISPADRAGIREGMYQYMQDTYSVNFDDVFDWQAWRDAYGSGE